MSVLYTNQTPLISRKGKLCCTVSTRNLIPTRIVASLGGGCYHLLSSLFGFTEQSSIRCCCSSSRLLLVTVLEMFHVACMSTPFLKFYRNAAVCFFSTSTSSGGFTVRIVIVVIVVIVSSRCIIGRITCWVQVRHWIRIRESISRNSCSKHGLRLRNFHGRPLSQNGTNTNRTLDIICFRCGKSIQYLFSW